jgi:hypothetical protein
MINTTAVTQVQSTQEPNLELATGIFNHLLMITTRLQLVETIATLLQSALMEPFAVSASTQVMLIFSKRLAESISDIGLLIKSVE